MNTSKNFSLIRNQILSAKKSIKIAVSWLTDERIINFLSQRVKDVKIDILLSNDPINAAFKFREIEHLQKSGALVLKTGVRLLDGTGFMHSKFMIIDEKYAFGGSYNFTVNASTNMENFGQYANETCVDLLKDFEEWKRHAIPFQLGFENYELIKEQVLAEFERKKRDLEEFDQKQFDTRDEIIVIEQEKEKKRKQAIEINTGIVGVTSTGKVGSGSNVVKSKPHRFYGGVNSFPSIRSKVKNSYGFSHYQKQIIESRYSFLKCKIENGILKAKGTFSIPGSKNYQVRINYQPGLPPMVFIDKPSIEFCSEIHVYSGGNLCLYYPGDQHWKTNTLIADYTIPWIFEWIAYYEIYLFSGKWEGPEVRH
jgi:hypothetical protein